MVLASRAAAEQRLSCGRAFTEPCTWAATIPLAAVPAEAGKRACLVLSDDIAAIVAAATEPEVAAVQEELALSTGNPTAATVLGCRPIRVDRYTAAAANGVAICWTELDAGYRLVACHAGAYILPALLAEAEATGALTSDVIASLAVAYEVTARIAHAFPSEPPRVHPHGAFAPLGAAAGVARLRGYAAKDFAAALSCAMTMSHAGPYSHAPAGALARNAWTATGAWAGYRAADWARLGIAGVAETVFDVMATCYGHACMPDRLTSELQTSWAICSG
jgi:2-methylcitrate dehydratase PrpD